MTYRGRIFVMKRDPPEKYPKNVQDFIKIVNLYELNTFT